MSRPAEDLVQKKTKKRLRPKSILEYLAHLNKHEGGVLDRLYTDTYTCLTIFRSLPPLAKQYVLRLLGIDKLVPKAEIDRWVKDSEEAKTAHSYALVRLVELKIWNFEQQVIDGKKETYLITNKSFQRQLRAALSLGDGRLRDSLSGVDGERGESKERDREREKGEREPVPTIEELDKYYKLKWDQILHFMVGSEDMGLPPPAVQDRLKRMGFMMQNEKKQMMTSDGFSFLFKDMQSQVWDIIIAYMDSLPERGMNQDEVLQFLFRLSFLSLGHDYPVSELTHTQRILLQDLVHFGLIFQSKPTSSRYYPTRLALNMSSAPGRSATEHDHQGYITLETTFKLYADTTNAFQIALLSLFARIDYRLPTTVVCTLTKASVRNAFKNNITSAQVISYLEQFASPLMRRNKPVLPETVVDQIRLWEAERNRLSAEEGLLLQDFGSKLDYDQTVHTISTLTRHGILWKNDSKLLLVASREGVDAYREWKKRAR